MSTNEKEWEKLAKAFDGCATTPVVCGEPASIWTDYQHVMGPVIKSNCKTGKISVAGFHHDYLGKARESGLIEFMDIVEKPHGCYQADWRYGNSETKLSSFFPSDWTPTKVINKVHEALKNPIEVSFLDGDKWIIKGKTSEGIMIKMAFDAHATSNFPTGKMISAYPDFNKG